MAKKSAPKKFTKQYSRKITESLPQALTKSENGSSFFTKKSLAAKSSVKSMLEHEFTLFTLIFLGICFIFLATVATFLALNYQNVASEHLAAENNYLYWNEVAKKQGNSPDAYYQAGIYAYELGKNKDAYDLLQKALDLDPGFKKAKILLRKLSG